MSTKRLLALVLAFCLVFGTLTPAASAVEAPENGFANTLVNSKDTNTANKTTVSPFENDLVVSGEDAAQKGNTTLRDKQAFEAETVTPNLKGKWSVTEGQKPQMDLLQKKTPDFLAELKEAAEIYSAGQVVRAFIVMEDAPLAESHTSPLTVSQTLEKQLLQKQDSVISAIERTVLQGKKLNVRYRFTYLVNAFTVETEFANLAKIGTLKGVKSVFIVPQYEACETVSNPNTAASGEMTGVGTVWADLDITGEGMKIAIIDTGLDLDHPSFSALDADMVAENDSYLDVSDVDKVLEKLNAYERRSLITGKTLYRSTKVPYAFNYCDSNLSADHSNDQQGDHGTHVAGIAAANKNENTVVVGMAPDAQIIVMKVFGAAGGAYTDDIVAALEDAMILGCDVVNASLGSPAGFSESGYDFIDSIYENIAKQNIIATISAGNEGPSSYANMWGTDLNRTQNPDNATIGSPSLYANAFSIASAENSEVQTPYFTLADGTTKVFFNNDSYGFYYGYTTGMAPLIGEELEYVMVPNYGAEEDFYDADGNSLVEGKVALVSRGEINFGDKIVNAELAGAVACIIVNNVSGDIWNFMMNDSNGSGEDIWFAEIPTCFITLEDGAMMAACETKSLTVAEGTAARLVEGGQMSSFSSWGVAPDLRLVPDITGIGGNVYSCYDGGKYGIMSGTSMSAPQVAGISALVMQYLYTKYPNANDGTISDMARAVLMSTADPVISSESEVEASPRQQGAGLVNAAEAVKAEAYLTVGGDRPKAELGDNASGIYTFSFEINNFSDAEQTYTLSSSLLTEDVVAYEGLDEYFMAGYNAELSGTVTFSAENNTVTVPANGKVTVNVTVQLSAEDKEMFKTYWANGGYVEGFVYLENAAENGVDLNLPFLGFYGDWTQAPVFDTAYWYDTSFWVDEYEGLPTGDEYHHVVWTDLAGIDWVLGFNPYSGMTEDEDGNVIYDPANNSVSPNGDGVADNFNELYLSLLRNAKTLTLTYTDDQGNELHKETVENNSKTMYRTSYGQVVPWLYSWYGEGMYDFAGVENGTKVTLTVTATVDYELGGTHSIQIPVTVDTEAPTLVDVKETVDEDGQHFIEITAKDNVNTAAILLMNRAGTQIYNEDYCTTANDDGSYTVTFAVDGLGTELMICLGDYAGNESYHNVTYTSAGENLPEMDTSLLYAYRSYDPIIEYYQGYDYMFGWQAMNKPETNEDGYSLLQSETNDYMEAYALTAAEYAGGKVFAVDAAYNLVVMDPGIWNRTTICNLGVNVLDMTFDDSTDTMYALTKDEDSYVALCSMDLLTGDMEMVCDYGYYYYAPYAITDDNKGTLYAIKYQGSNLYTLTAENEWAMTAVQVAAGTDETTGETLYTNLVLTDAEGSKTKPNYNQSMTFSDGKIYWGYFYMSYYGAVSSIIVIDTANGFAFENYDTVSYYAFAQQYTYSTNELVGMLVLEETEYQLPAAEALEGINLSQESLVLMPGQSVTLNANPIPWNYKLTNVIWSSDTESVATVVDGKVTAVGEGTAVITVTSEEMTAECLVTVVDTETTFKAYNYYSGDDYYGYTIEVDTGIMDYYLLEESPVDFLAADYNGHDGYYYGYSNGGQFWRYDPETNEAVKLGDPIGSAPADMAYDYSTGKMYAVSIDYSTYCGVLSIVDLNNGSLETVVAYEQVFFMTVACGPDGTVYTITADGMLVALKEVYDDWFEEYTWTPEILMMDLGGLQYMQSMCYDYANDVLIWAYCEGGTLVWIDPAAGYTINLGDPTGSGLFEFVGMYTVPAEIPTLDAVSVTSAEAADMMLLVGAEKVPNVTIRPHNATCQDVQWTSDNTEVVTVTESGALKAVAIGTANITGVLKDTVADTELELTFKVTVLEGADDLYGHLMTDLETQGGQTWLRLYPTDTTTPDYMEFTDYVLYAEEYYDGKLYAYGYDPNDWSSAWQFFVMDPVTHKILEQVAQDDSFPFVYDMTYDYATSTMYCVAGAGSNDSDLYAVDLETGALVLLMATEEFFMSLAAGPDGTLYAMEQSVTEQEDWWSPAVVYNAQLYKIDLAAGTVTKFADTGIKSNMLASMTYDYDTDYLYWSALAQEGAGYTGGLCLIDPATGAATNLGMIGNSGSQVSGLYVISENVPEEGEPTLHGLVMDTAKTVVNVGSTVAVNANTLPLTLEAEIQWTSSDEEIATVEGGVITGVGQGKATITATAVYGEITKSASCEVAVLAEDAAFLTWNESIMGWSLISRSDYTVVTDRTQGEMLGVQAVDAVGNDVYGFDDNGCLFQLDAATFKRTVIGESINETVVSDFRSYHELDAGEYPLDMFKVEVRDMAYDAANERMLILTSAMMYEEEFDMISEMNQGDWIYTVDLTTGEVASLYTFENDYNIYGLAVDENGLVYWYCTYDDYVRTLDLSTQEVTELVSLQTQSMYGNNGLDVHVPLFYDGLTGQLFLLFTSNSEFYRMAIIDPATGALTASDEYGDALFIGNVEYDYDEWAYVGGEAFAGMTFLEMPEFIPTPQVVSNSVSLKGNVGVNYYMFIPENVQDDDNAYMQFTTEDGETVQVKLSEAPTAEDENGETRYVFSVQMPAKEMNDVIKAQFFYGDDQSTEERSYSVRSYADYILEDTTGTYDDVKPMVKAMLHYGAYAQKHFGYKTDDLADKDLEAADLSGVDADAVSGSQATVEGEVAAKYLGNSLLLKGETTMRFFFEKKEGVELVITCGEETLTQQTRGNMIYVEIQNIAAKDLDKVFTLNVSDNSGNTATISASALTYVYNVLSAAENTYSADLEELVKALYLYNEAANTYFGE